MPSIYFLMFGKKWFFKYWVSKPFGDSSIITQILNSTCQHVHSQHAFFRIAYILTDSISDNLASTFCTRMIASIDFMEVWKWSFSVVNSYLQKAPSINYRLALVLSDLQFLLKSWIFILSQDLMTVDWLNSIVGCKKQNQRK